MTAAVPAPYDVFVSYNWRDREAVERVARALRENDLNAFLDRWYLVPGEPWQRALETARVPCIGRTPKPVRRATDSRMDTDNSFALDPRVSVSIRG